MRKRTKSVNMAMEEEFAGDSSWITASGSPARFMGWETCTDAW